MKRSVCAGLVVFAIIATGCVMRSAQQAVPQRAVFHGLSLEGVPRTTSFTDLRDLFHESPPGSGSYSVRSDAVQIYSEIDGTVCHVPAKNRFYVQHDPVGSSILTIYGPFDGDPTKVMDISNE